MVVALLLLGQLAVADSTYATVALRRFVAAAAATCVPADLQGYSARLETDVAVLLTDVQGREHATQLEQMESELRWRRAGQLEQHVIGYRSRGGPTLSALTLLRRPWVVPTLYESRLRLLLGSAALEGASDGPGGVLAVHPLAQDRDSVYRFTGGDTVLVMQASNRRVTLVRVHVAPRDDLNTKLLVFRGYLDIDAERKHIVHMRGELGVVTHQSLLARARQTVLRRSVFVEVLEAEFGGRFWLPTYERVDVHARSDLSEGFRPGFRMVTRFRDHSIDTLSASAAVALDTVKDRFGELTFASNDSLNDFKGWRDEIGADATRVGAHDFDDVARDQTRLDDGRLHWRAEQLSDVFRYNKVEGLYAGVAGGAQLGGGDSARALSLKGHVGWSSEEEDQARGAALLAWRGDRWRAELTAQRELANTSDFLPPLEGPATVGALLASIDDYDYVGRTSGQLALTYAPYGNDSRLLRFEIGPGRDAAVSTNVLRGLFLFDSKFRPNRPVTEGDYLRESVGLSVNPGVSGDFLEPGVGLDVSYERGDGQLRWQRVDALLAARHTLGPLTYFGRVDGAAVFGGSPYQRLIEFGENEGMPGFGYKAFGGDRAAIGRLGVTYGLPFLSAPLRVRRWLTLPGPTPAFTFGIHAGWSAAIDAATRDALTSVGYKPGPDGVPVLRTGPTGRVRSSVALAFDFFGGAIGLGVAHPLDRGGWVLILGSQQW